MEKEEGRSEKVEGEKDEKEEVKKEDCRRSAGVGKTQENRTELETRKC